MSQKRIGVLTSGGDCPGLNAVIRAVVKCACHLGWEVYGIPYGTDGLSAIARGQCQPEDLKLRDHGYDLPGLLKGLDILQFLSGSILGSLSKGDPVQDRADILRGYEMLQLDGLIAIGGDGSLEILAELAHHGQWKMVVIPKTIDNDVPKTERAVGFDTAINTVTKSLFDLTFTAASHERVMVVQVMGRDAGHLALHAGIAGGADAILIPELTPKLTPEVVDRVCHQIANMRLDGRNFALIVISEGIKDSGREKESTIADVLSQEIRKRSQELCQLDQMNFCGMDKVDTRVVILGHLQRSGTPSSFDRLLATSFAKKAVDLIQSDQHSHLVVWENGDVSSYSLEEILPYVRQCHQEERCPNPVQPDDMMVQTARSMGICLGDDRCRTHANCLNNKAQNANIQNGHNGHHGHQEGKAVALDPVDQLVTS